MPLVQTQIHKILGQQLELLPEKAIYWKDQNSLLIADLHLGKASHFRKAGIPVPLQAADANFRLLDLLVQNFSPDAVFLLGDLFHSSLNNEWEMFADWRTRYSSMEVHLIRGNHDILPVGLITAADIEFYPEELLAGPFLLRHEPVASPVDGVYVLAGHIHPSVLLQGKGKQNFSLPCFWFGPWQGLLPAFGQFTGTARVNPSRSDAVYVIAENEVLKIS